MNVHVDFIQDTISSWLQLDVLNKHLSKTHSIADIETNTLSSPSSNSSQSGKEKRKPCVKGPLQKGEKEN